MKVVYILTVVRAYMTEMAEYKVTPYNKKEDAQKELQRLRDLDLHKIADEYDLSTAENALTAIDVVYDNENTFKYIETDVEVVMEVTGHEVI